MGCILTDLALQTFHRTRLAPLSVVNGYNAYFAVNDNARRANMFLHMVKRFPFEALNRRSNKKSYNWSQFSRYLKINRYPKRVRLKDIFFVSRSYHSISHLAGKPDA